MPRVAYVNGQYLPHYAAAVHVEDRGYQFADGVYEVIAVRGGRLIDEAQHLDRLDRSLAELRIRAPMARAPLQAVLREVLRRNRVADGIVYMQVSRGVAPRDHAFPRAPRPSFVVTTRRAKRADPAVYERGVRVVTLPDIRWKRRDIKSVSLLPNVLAKQQALDAGAYDAWLVDDDGFVTEGSASNAWIVTEAGEVVTRPPSFAILNGITRRAVAALTEAEGLRYVERCFTVAEAHAATEAFLTSTTSRVMPVVEIDGVRIGMGRPGRLARRLLALYLEHETDDGNARR